MSNTKYSDLDFKPHHLDWGPSADLTKLKRPEQAVVSFPNGYTASVIRGSIAYGGDDGLNEVAVLDENGLCYDTPITDNVIGYLNESDFEEVLGRIRDLPKPAEKSAA